MYSNSLMLGARVVLADSLQHDSSVMSHSFVFHSTPWSHLLLHLHLIKAPAASCVGS